MKPMFIGSHWANFQIAVADGSTRLFLNTRRHVYNNNKFDFPFIGSSKMSMSKKWACTCLEDFLVTSFLCDYTGSWFGVPNWRKNLSVRCSCTQIW